MRRRLLAVPVALALLAGCASNDPASAVRERVAAVIDAANARDETGVRLAVADLIELLGEQTRSNDLTPQEAQAIANAARQVAERAGELAPSPSPSPVVTEEPSPPPAPSPEPTREEPSPTPEPTQEEPEPTEEPDDDETDEPIVELPTSAPTTQSAAAPSPSPAAQGGGGQPTPAPTV